ncbi:hypothetical protein Tco_0916138 [Tanacetum coccineum]
MHKAYDGQSKAAVQFCEKYMDTVRFGNHQFALILGYRYLVQGNIMINRVYYVEGLNHNLFSVGQFCDADLEVAFQKSTCFVRDLQGNDLLTEGLSVIGLTKTLKYVKDQISHRQRTRDLDEVSKAKRSSFKIKAVPSSKGRLNLLHIDLCGPMRVASVNGKKYILMKEKGDPCLLVGILFRLKDIEFTTFEPRLICNDNRMSDYDGLWPRAPNSQKCFSFSKIDSTASLQQEYASYWSFPLYDEILTTANGKFFKEGNMDDSAWIEAMHEELHQFDRIQVWEIVGQNPVATREISS